MGADDVLSLAAAIGLGLLQLLPLYLPALVFLVKSYFELKPAMMVQQQVGFQLKGAIRYVLAGALALLLAILLLPDALPIVIKAVGATAITPYMAFLCFAMPYGLSFRLWQPRLNIWDVRSAADQLLVSEHNAFLADEDEQLQVQPAERVAAITDRVLITAYLGWVELSEDDPLPVQYVLPRPIRQAVLFVALIITVYPVALGLPVLFGQIEASKVIAATGATLFGPLAFWPAIKAGGIMLVATQPAWLVILLCIVLMPVAFMRNRFGFGCAIAVPWLYVVAVALFLPTTYEMWDRVDAVRWFNNLKSLPGLDAIADYASGGLYSMLRTVLEWLSYFSISSLLGLSVAIWLRFAIRGTFDLLVSEEANIYYRRRIRVPSYLGNIDHGVFKYGYQELIGDVLNNGLVAGLAGFIYGVLLCGAAFGLTYWAWPEVVDYPIATLIVCALLICGAIAGTIDSSTSASWNSELARITAAQEKRGLHKVDGDARSRAETDQRSAAQATGKSNLEPEP